MNILYIIYNLTYNKLIFKSIQSKIFSIFALISLILTSIQYSNFFAVLSKFIIYFVLIRQIECSVYGGCEIGAWLNIILPILSIIIVLLDYFEILNNFKKKLNKFININKNIIK